MSEANIIAEIQKLKVEKNAVLLVHYYQTPKIQELADFLGDSLALSQQAATTDADIIVFAGVHFMAETAKILNPHKKVLIPDLEAGCSLADSCPPDRFLAFKKMYPNHMVISYINCSAEIKAMSDIICTSSNAIKIVESLPNDQKIIFAPDKNLGNYINGITKRNMLLWDGACMVHEVFSSEKLVKLKIEHPKAKLLAHPECKGPVLKIADFVGSTTALLNYTISSSEKEFIIATEPGVIYQMQKASPNKVFLNAPINATETCSCSDCVYMKMNTIEKLYNCLKNETPEINLSEEIRKKAEIPIRRMLKLSAQ